MKRRNRQSQAYFPLVGILPLVVAFAPSAHAEDAPPAATSSSELLSVAATLGAPAQSSPSAGLPVAGFLVYPSLFAGVIYNDNVYPTQDDRKATLGFAFAPRITAIDDGGLHKTTLNLSADARIFPGYAYARSSDPSPNSISGAVSLAHLWRPAEDLTVAADVGLLGNMDCTVRCSRGSNFVAAASAGGTATYPQFSNQFSGSISVEKKFSDQWFLRGGFGAQEVNYESVPPGVVGGGRSGADYNAFLRTGMWITPQINAFVEGGADFRRYRDNWYDSNAYRLIGGLSSDMIGLFRGEVFAGWQQLVSAEGTFNSVQAPAYGGKIYYYPTPYLTLAASLSELFGSAATPSLPKGARSPSAETVDARFQADYGLAEYWTAFLRAGYARTSWSNDPLVEFSWSLGGGVSYAFWRNVSLTLNYQYTATAANQPGVAVYNQNLVSTGMTYRY